MATTPKNTPAADTNKQATVPAKRSGRKAATEPPALDFSKLVVADAAPVVRQTSVSAADNPTLPWVKDSWNNKTAKAPGVFWGKGKQVPVPTANAAQVVSLIRSAVNALARETGDRIGLAVKAEDLGNGKTMVRFMTKTAKAAYTRKKENDTTENKAEGDKSSEGTASS